MKVSIVIPVYNTEKYISRCIQSCLNQTYNDYEIIVINDGSTDGSEAIVAQYSRKYDRIKLVSINNSGLSIARNIGMDMANGEYIYFLDSDDWIDSDCLEKCCYYADEHKLDIVCFDAKTVLEEGAPPKYLFATYDRKNKINEYVVETGIEYTNNYEHKPIHVSAWTVFLRREFLINNRIHFLEKVFYEDIKFHYDCMLAASRIMYIPFQFYNRTYRKESIITSNVSFKKVESIFNVAIGILDSAEKYLGENKTYWIQYGHFLVCLGCRTALEQINGNNVAGFREYWEIIERYIAFIVKKYLNIITKNNSSLSVCGDCLELIYKLVYKFDFLSVKIQGLVEDVDMYRKNYITECLKQLPLKDATKKVGIYGVGKHADYIIDFYRRNLGDIESDITFIDSNKISYAEQKDGKDIINIKDVSCLNLDSIIIMSYLHEEIMYSQAREYVGSNLPIYKLYDGKEFPFDTHSYKEDLYKERIKSISKEMHRRKRFILINVPEHTNIGDYMITLAEEEFIKKYYSEYEIIEFSGLEYAKNRESIRNQIHMSDVIGITGGGYLGNMWFSGSNINNILEDFRYNKIVIFPQTIYFKEDENKKKEIEKLYKSLLMCADVSMCLREKMSYNYANKIFHHHIKTYLMPDIVLSLEKCENIGKRQGVLLCLRKDEESIILESDRLAIWDKAKEISDKVSVTSMHWHEIIDNERKEIVIEQKLEEIRSAELVITDTLHCMISCVITGTPCIAINNLTGKVKGSYEWVEELKYVKYFDSAKEFLQSNLIECIEIGGMQEYTSIFKEYEKILKSIISGDKF